jgi:hypothetical protein
MHERGARTRREIVIDLFEHWIKIFALVFGMGVLSGIVISYGSAPAGRRLRTKAARRDTKGPLGTRNHGTLGDLAGSGCSMGLPIGASYGLAGLPETPSLEKSVRKLTFWRFTPSWDTQKA